MPSAEPSGDFLEVPKVKPFIPLTAMRATPPIKDPTELEKVTVEMLFGKKFAKIQLKEQKRI